MINYEAITDRYESPLKEPKQDPTLLQGMYAWALLNELLELGYPHNFQHERADLADYGYNISAIIDKARMIRDLGER
ncbi:hypothetical protein [Eubacterium pyruvativorans]|uniref:hypothetical protein n=1 Tax=Eubacterium pyruvativorans TaxID=155865 RepID=UPI0015651243|nr:hypothetical protein [Eubacterium pyruvativorans]